MNLIPTSAQGLPLGGRMETFPQGLYLMFYFFSKANEKDPKQILNILYLLTMNNV
jgi:hypothetical protein